MTRNQNLYLIENAFIEINTSTTCN